jgi:hypothetical protein
MSSRPAPKSANACVLALTAAGLLSLWAAAGGFAATLPTPPQVFIDTTYSAPAGNTITVNAGDNFQAALNNAQLGDTIVLQAGATFAGPFTLPNKTTGTGWIYIQSSNYSSLPAPGKRVGPADAANMPKITVATGGRSAIETANNAHHFRFVGIEFKPVANNFVYNLIRIGNADTSTATLPDNIVFDRCYIHGDPDKGGRRGVAMDGTRVAVIDSHVSDFKEVGADTQALWAYNTPGPLKITNNYLEAAGENVMFGGADSSIADCVPSDIEIRRNLFFKPLSWMGSAWSVKNLLEFKNARRVLVERNRFENNWAAAQSGFSLLITPRNQGGSAPWSATQDITISLNKFVNLGQGINILGTDDNHPSQRTARVLIENNVIEVTGLGSSGGRLFQILSGPVDITIDHNTAFCTGPYGMSENLTKADQFVFQNNVVTKGSYGFIGTGTADGIGTLNTFYTNWQFTNNAIIGGAAANYPAGNFFPSSIEAVSFLNAASGDYRLADSSPYKNAGTDGNDLGATSAAIAPPKGLKVIP